MESYFNLAKLSYINFYVFKGKSSRKELVSYFIFSVLINILLIIMVYAINKFIPESVVISIITVIPLVFIYIIQLVAGLAIISRRINDIGFNGKLVLVSLIGFMVADGLFLMSGLSLILYVILYIVVFCVKGKSLSNNIIKE